MRQAAVPAGGKERIPYKWLALTVVSVGTFMSLLDSTMVNIALPTITRSLHTDVSTVQWVVTTYLLVITSTLLPFGRLGDMFGRERIYTAGFAVFTVGSGLCGLAQDVSQLIVFRAFQGVGAGMMMAISPAIGAGSFPPKERGMALGISTMTVSVGAMAGPTLGGLLIDVFDWRTAFFLRVPFGVLGIVWALLVLRNQVPAGRGRGFDLPGAASLGLTLVFFLLAVGQGQRFGWSSPLILACFVTAVGGGLVFYMVERRVRAPLVQLSLFRNRVFVGASLASLLSFMAGSASQLLMPFYLQQGLGYPAAHAGLIMIPGPILSATLSPISGWLSDRIGTRILSLAGISLQCTGLLLYATLGEDSTAGDVVARLLVSSLGMALFSSPNNSTIMSSVSPSLLGFASSTLATMRNLGMSIGIAAAAAVYTARLAYHTAEQAPFAANSEALASGALIASFRDTVIVGAAISSLGILASVVRARQVAAEEEPAPPVVAAAGRSGGGPVANQES